jgi:FkbM family methyltransferase
MTSVLYDAMRFIGHQEWIRWGRMRFVHTFVDHSKIGPTPFVIPFFGLSYAGDLSNWIDWNVFFFGAYTKHELALLQDLAKGRKVTFCDVGANTGVHTLFMSRLAEQVISFEPMPRALQALKANVERNGLENVRIHEVALGDIPGPAKIATRDLHNLGTSAIRDTDGGYDIEIVRGDDLALPKIDILKVDVEGFESKVFAGLRETILRDRPAIMTELSGASKSGFLDARGLEAAVYPDHRLYTIAARGSRYNLLPLDLNRGGHCDQEVLCLPLEYKLPK